MRTTTAILFTLFFCSLSVTAAETAYFDSAGVKLRYISGGAGETVVLLHGFSGSAEGLYVIPGTFDALVNAGYRVVALDQRGHGQSEKPHEVDSYGMEMVEDVRRLLDHLDLERVHLVGYSMGGKVSNSFRATYPDRLLTITLGGYGWPWQSAEITLDESRERMQQRTILPGNDVAALAAVSVGMYDLTPAEENLRTNNVPAFAIIGDKDEVVSAADLATLKSTMANLDVVVIPGTHAGPDGAPYKPAFAEKLIGFLSKH
jgi:pimeloyl-ACP methyl ester carboxylesterase